ncbi:GNAT family N-acetyltransferase [Humisphaera borealis]|uniref:GNAT family N-acetyltransferase n=1 Tax=Humisphaera borealis TaxID=2807512 RepID=A0A7M2WTI7_9BACT|nr:GNAT family N-acetyltransferase [Humisphaera borealis]QOV88482.1 GNAT family N-acetyltransferase [Humisphaera borealis]
MVHRIPPLTYRTIDPARDADLCAANHYDACLASFGRDCKYEGRESYLRWLTESVQIYPEGFVLAFRGERFIGQLELQVPYGMPTGYVSLFYVSPDVRGRGYGNLIHQYAEVYFRAWEARTIELDVSPQNIRAIRFYRRMGYAFADRKPGKAVGKDARLWRMTRTLDAGTPSLQD